MPDGAFSRVNRMASLCRLAYSDYGDLYLGLSPTRPPKSITAPNCACRLTRSEAGGMDVAGAASWSASMSRAASMSPPAQTLP